MTKIYQYIELTIARVMFVLTIFFLSLVAILIQYLQTSNGLERLPRHQEMIDLLVILWPIFFLERILDLFFCPKKTWKNYVAQFFVALLPPLRLAVKRCKEEEYILWDFNWHFVDKSLCDHIEKRFLYPILAFSIVMIPFWMSEIFFPQQITRYPLIYHIINLGNAFIWGLFVIEFVIMFSLTKKRTHYLTTHWLELFIIILPMLALARYILISKYLSLSKQAYWFVKLQRILNVYRARSVLTRIIRILIVINIVKRIYQRRNPKKYLIMLQEELEEKEQEIAKLKKQISEIKKLI